MPAPAVHIRLSGLPLTALSPPFIVTGLRTASGSRISTHSATATTQPSAAFSSPRVLPPSQMPASRLAEAPSQSPLPESRSISGMKFSLARVRVGARVLRIGRTSFTLAGAIFDADRCAATAQVVAVLFDLAQRRSVEIPADLRQTLSAYA